MLTLPLPLYTPASTSLNPLTPSQMTVHPTHPSQVTLSTRAFPAGLSHVRGLCGPHGRRLDVTLQTDKHAGGSNNFVIHGTAAAAGAGGASSTGNGSPLEDGTGFAVIARMRLERGGYQSSRVPGTLQGRAVPCAPAESNGGQRCAALQEACDGLFSTLKTTLDLQGVPGWPQIYGLGCCEYRLNSTHAAPLVVDARQPLQTSAMWDRGQAGGDWASEYRMQAKAAAPQPLAKAGALVHGQNDRALSACLDARPPLSLEQCALRAALLSAELLRGLTEERMYSLNEHVLVPSRRRRRLQETRRRLQEMLAPGKRLAAARAAARVSPSARRTSLPVRPPKTLQALLKGLGGVGNDQGQFAFVRATGQVAAVVVLGSRQ